jgi:stage II sporulation protein D
VVPAKAAFWGNIPQTTMQIAREAGAEENFVTPSSKLVRVGIGTNGFSSYEWDKATIYATGEFEVYNNKTYINTYDSNCEINISMVGRIFVLTDAEGNVIEKVSGPIIFKTDFGYVGVKGLKRAGHDAIYRGTLKLVSSSKEGKFHIVNELELEDYLKGVVPAEMPPSWEFEALKAQSIAARSYALANLGKQSRYGFDLKDNTEDQAYGGASVETNRTTRAVEETDGLVLTYDMKIIPAYYSASAGGMTNTSSWGNNSPFLHSVPSFDDDVAKNGHGVGMSQHGANNLAKQGYNAYQILLYFYQNVKFAKLDN